MKVETPFGTVETTRDPQAAARNLGVDLYPGAQVMKEGSTSMTFGNVHTAALTFETSDPVDKVCSFYKPKFPNAMVMTTQTEQCTIVSNDQKNMITIKAKIESGKTRIAVSYTHLDVYKRQPVELASISLRFNLRYTLADCLQRIPMR